MKNYLSGKRQVARTHFKSLLAVGLLASSAAAQQLPIDVPALPELPGLAQLPTQAPATTTAKSWNAGQRVTWILGLRSRKPLSLQQTQSMEFELPKRDVLVSESMSTGPAVCPPFSTIAQVQFVDEGVPQVPVHVRSAAPVVDLTQPPPPALPALGTSEPPRIGAGPIMTAPVAPLPLEQLDGDDSLTSVDVTGVNAADVGAEQEAADDKSLIDGLVMPGNRTQVQTKASEKYSLSDKQAMPERGKATLSMHEGFTPRRVEEPAIFKLADDSRAGESQTPTLFKSSASKVRMAIGDNSTDETSASDSSVKVQEPVEQQLSDHDDQESGGTLASLNDHSESVETEEVPSTLLKVPEPLVLPTLTPPVPTLSLSDKAPGEKSLGEKSLGEKSPGEKQVALKLPEAKSSPITNSISDPLTPPGPISAEPAVTKVDPKAIDQAIAALDSLPLGEKPASAPQLLPSKMIAQEAPSGATPIVAAPKVKLPAAKQLETKPTRQAAATPGTAVKTASASEPTDPVIDSVIESDDEDVSYARVAAKVAQAVKQKFPTSRVRVSCDEDGLVVEGIVSDSQEATKVMAFVRKTSLCPAADRLTCKR